MGYGDGSGRSDNHDGPGDRRQPAGGQDGLGMLMSLARSHLVRRWSELAPGPDPEPPIILEDRSRGVLTVPGLGVSIGLAQLAAALTAVEPARWPDEMATFLDDALAARAAAAGLSVGTWADVEPRLVVRMVDSAVAGPWARPLTDETALDLAVVVGPGTVRPTAALLDAWPRDREQIWSVAAANTRRTLRPDVAQVAAGEIIVMALTADRDVSGAALDVRYFLRQAGIRSPQVDGPLWLSMRTTTLALVLAPATVDPTLEDPSFDRPSSEETVRRLVVTLFGRRWPWDHPTLYRVGREPSSLHIVESSPIDKSVDSP